MTSRPSIPEQQSNQSAAPDRDAPSSIRPDGNTTLYNASKRIAHDLKAPVRQIAQLAEILTEDSSSSLNDDAIEMIGMINDRAKRLDGIIDAVRAFSDAHCRPLTMREIDLSDLVSDVAYRLDEQDNINIHNPLPVVPGDSLLVGRLFEILLDLPSLLASDTPIKELSVSARSGANGETQLEFVLAPYSLAPEKAELFFDPFMIAFKDEPIAGFGLALAECKAICDRFGWGIYLNNSASDQLVIILQL